GFRTNILDQLDHVYSGQAQVEDHKVKDLFLQGLQCTVKVASDLNLESMRLEFFPVDLSGKGIVIHDQDRLLFGRRENSFHRLRIGGRQCLDRLREGALDAQNFLANIGKQRVCLGRSPAWASRSNSPNGRVNASAPEQRRDWESCESQFVTLVIDFCLRRAFTGPPET